MEIIKYRHLIALISLLLPVTCYQHVFGVVYFAILLNSATVIAVAMATLRLSAVSRSGG